jgi:ribosomal protein S18 acetylase RimI-like enzyme
MEVERPSVSALDDLVDLWVDLAADQRAVGSHLHADRNRERVREALAGRVAVGGAFVARDDAGLVGFVTFYPESETYAQDCTRGIVENLYVVPDRRGEGIGERLLGAAEAALEAGGAEAVALEALADNDRARRFYERHGYRQHRIEFERRLSDEDETDTSEGE